MRAGFQEQLGRAENGLGGQEQGVLARQADLTPASANASTIMKI